MALVGHLRDLATRNFWVLRYGTAWMVGSWVSFIFAFRRYKSYHFRSVKRVWLGFAICICFGFKNQRCY